jgi:hypothetical protein
LDHSPIYASCAGEAPQCPGIGWDWVSVDCKCHEI